MKEITPDRRRGEYVRLAEHLRREVSAIFRMTEEISPEAEEPEGRVKAVAAKLKELSDHCEHHIEDMEPAEETDEQTMAPGAVMSGFTTPSARGPMLENEANEPSMVPVGVSELLFSAL